MLLGARQFFERRGAPTPPLPYDAEVEYLESTGTQYIDTGVYGTLDTVANLRAVCTATSGFQALFGARAMYNHRALAVYNGSDQGFKYTISYDGLSVAGNRLVSTESSNDGRWLDFSIGLTTKIGTWSATHSNATSFTTINTLLVFAWNQNGSIVTGAYKVSSCSILEDGILVRDFIPVRFTNEHGVSEGAMYDRVSGALFRNAGTGAFTIGPDKL